MSRKKKPDLPTPAPDQEPVQRMTLEEFKILAAQADGHPERISALVKQLVLQTLGEVRESVAEGRSKPA